MENQLQESNIALEKLREQVKVNPKICQMPSWFRLTTPRFGALPAPRCSTVTCMRVGTLQTAPAATPLSTDD
eukprot:2053937-Pyramimonas_sp.AAC.3